MENSSSLPSSTEQEDSAPAVVNKGFDSTKYYWIAETLTRITFAGFGGSLYGSTLENKYIENERQTHLGELSKSLSKNGLSKRLYPPLSSPQSVRHNPSLISPITSGGTVTNFRMTWAISCMVFVSILETCRITSPTSKLLAAAWYGEYSSNYDDNPKTSELQRVVFVAISDYTIGGMVAGYAGALARTRGKATNFFAGIPVSLLQAGQRPLLGWGVATGICFGMLAGMFQALADVGNLYLAKQ